MVGTRIYLVSELPWPLYFIFYFYLTKLQKWCYSPSPISASTIGGPLSKAIAFKLCFLIFLYLFFQIYLRVSFFTLRQPGIVSVYVEGLMWINLETNEGVD